MHADHVDHGQNNSVQIKWWFVRIKHWKNIFIENIVWV